MITHFKRKNMHQNNNTFFYGWYVAISCSLVYFFVNSMTLFVPQNLFPTFIDEFSLSREEVSLTVRNTLLFAAFLSPLSGILIDRYGVTIVMRIGIIIMALTYSFYPFASSIETLYRLHILMAAGLVMSGLGPNVIIVSNWFNKHRGKVVGMVVASSSLGGATLPLLISPIVNNPEWGWRWGFGLLSIFFWIFAVIPVYKVIRSSPEAMGLRPDGHQETSIDSAESQLLQSTENKDKTEFKDALFSRALFCLGIGSACLWFAIQGLNSQIRIFFELDVGFTAQQSVLLFSIIYWFSFIGKFSFGALSDRLPKRTVLFISSCVLFLGSLLLFEISGNELILTNNTMQLSLFTIFFGLGFGGSFSMIQLVAVETFGKKYLGRVLGIISMIDGLAAAGATQLLASMADDASGSYLGAFGLVAIVTLIGIINVFFIKPIKIKSKSTEDLS